MLHEDYDEALGNFSKVLMKEPANALARINVGYICLKKGIFGEAIEHLSKAIRLDNDRKATLYAHYYLGLVYLEREMYEDAQTFLPEDPASSAPTSSRRTSSWAGLSGSAGSGKQAGQSLDRRLQGQQVQSRGPNGVRKCWKLHPPEVKSRAVRSPSPLRTWARAPQPEPPPAIRVGPVTAVAWPEQLRLATDLARRAAEPTDWPGLGRRSPGPLRLIVVPDARRLDSLSAGRAPGWGAAVALARERTSCSFEPIGDALYRTLRHELAHLALHEAIDVRVPLWFDEGYAAWAAGEWERLGGLELNLAVVRGAVPDLPGLMERFEGLLQRPTQPMPWRPQP